MQKITYLNDINGRSFTFSSSDPLNFLEKLSDTCESNAITYQPAEYDGLKFICANLAARNITLSVQFTAKLAGRYDKAAARDKAEDILGAFQPCAYGTLTFTDGERTRQIRCRTVAVPEPKILAPPCLYSMEIQLIADNPYWIDPAEQTFTIDNADRGRITVRNECAVTVPFVIELARKSVIGSIILS